MLKLKIFSIGKNKERWLEEAIQEYTKRLQPTMSIEWIWAKDSSHLVELVRKEPFVICLDPAGQMHKSEQFAAYLQQAWISGKSRLVFVIGGAEGLPIDLKKNYPLISLSSLTFTHQLTRLILIEQIYRAMEILKGSDYHK